jgi:tripartite-type tricarboxylate transporter receptor subunit TctC
MCNVASRTIFGAMSALAAAMLLAGNAYAADSFPAKPVRLIVGFAPGGGTDIIARTVGHRLTDLMGQTFVVDNRPGAGGVIGADIVAHAAPDGYTLLVGTPGPLTINPNLRKNMPYQLSDLATVTQMTVSPFILIVNPSLPVKSVKELIALAKAKPGQLNYGSAGNGSTAHLATEQLKALAHIDITHVPYKGSSQSMVDLIAGQVQVLIENAPVVMPQVRAGKVRPLAVGTKTRFSLMPELPTMEEAGVPGYEQTSATGILAPKDTPRAIVMKLNGAIVKVVHEPAVQEVLARAGAQPVGGTPEQYAEYLREDLARVGKLVRTAGIHIE